MLLQFSAWNWRDCSATPLWLAIQGPGWKPNPQLIQHLSRLAKAKNIAVVATKEGVEYPLFLPTHAERDQVFQGALDQLSIAVEWLQKLKSTELDSLAIVGTGIANLCVCFATHETKIFAALNV